MSDERRKAVYPLVLMVQRWDGGTGFIGGFQDAGYTLLETADKELKEEANLNLVNYTVELQGEEFQMVPVCAHELDKLVVHLYHLDLGLVEKDMLKDILANSLDAEHCISEGTLTWVHLEDYGWGKGRDKILNSNTLASAVKEELQVILSRITK